MREVTKTANSLSDYPSKSVSKLAQAISELSESPELSESACNLVKVNQSILKTILVSVRILKTSMSHQSCQIHYLSFINTDSYKH